MRILFLSGYNHPSQHRKVELLADSPDIDILHILGPESNTEEGQHLSANGRRRYRVKIVPVRQLGQPGDPHRAVHWPPDFGLREFAPDIIHCEHEQESLMAAEAALARDVLARPTPLVLHSWQNIARRTSLPVKLVCAYTRRAAQHILCGNQEAAAVLRRHGYRGRVTVTNILGLDRRFFYPKPATELRARLGLEGIVVGFFGRRVPEKGVDVLLRAAAQVRSPIRVLIGGSGPETANLTALAAQLGIADRCLFLDGQAIAYDAVVDYMNLLDVLVVPSRTTPNWKEQLGRVLIEGMGCKVAVVGSSSGAIPEVIGEAGRIFAEDDAGALARIIDELAADQDLRRTLAERGYRRVIETYSVERLARDVADVWQSLTAHR